MEQKLRRLEEQEEQYSTALDAALDAYMGLRKQAQRFDPAQLYEARQLIRPGKEKEAVNRVQEIYRDQYNPLLMLESKKAVSRLCNEETEGKVVWKMAQRTNREEPFINKGRRNQNGEER